MLGRDVDAGRGGGRGLRAGRVRRSGRVGRGCGVCAYAFSVGGEAVDALDAGFPLGVWS